MPVYTLSPEDLRAAGPKPWRQALYVFACYVPVYFSLEYLPFLFDPRRTLVGKLIQAVTQGAVLSVWFAWLQRRQMEKYTLTVSEDEIATGFMFVNRSVHQGMVRTLIQRRDGLLVSQRGRIGTFFWGGVWIPKALPQYESVASLVTSWKVL